LLHHVSKNINEPEIASRVTVSERFMVKAEQVQDRRVKVVHMDLVPCNAQGDFICGLGGANSLGIYDPKAVPYRPCAAFA